MKRTRDLALIIIMLDAVMLFWSSKRKSTAHEMHFGSEVRKSPGEGPFDMGESGRPHRCSVLQPLKTPGD